GPTSESKAKNSPPPSPATNTKTCQQAANRLFAVERGALLSQGVASAGSPSAVEQNTRAVVVMVAVSAAGAFDLFDRGVRGFGLGVGHPCFDERFDLRPPGVDRFG